MTESLDLFAQAEQGILAEMRQLIDLLRQNSYAYYVLDEPVIEDIAYDQLTLRLKALEDANPTLIQSDSPTGRVGGGGTGTVSERGASGAHAVIRQCF